MFARAFGFTKKNHRLNNPTPPITCGKALTTTTQTPHTLTWDHGFGGLNWEDQRAYMQAHVNFIRMVGIYVLRSTKHLDTFSYIIMMFSFVTVNLQNVYNHLGCFIGQRRSIEIRAFIGYV